MVFFRIAWRSMAGWELTWASVCHMVTLGGCFSSLCRNISTQWGLQPFRQLVPVVHYIRSLFTTLVSGNTLFSFLKQPHMLGHHYHMSYSPPLLGLNSLRFFRSSLQKHLLTFLLFLLLLFEHWLVQIFHGNAAGNLTEDCRQGLGITKQNQRTVLRAGCTCRFIHPRMVFPFFQCHRQLKTILTPRYFLENCCIE